MKPRTGWEKTVWSIIGAGLLILLPPMAATAGDLPLTWDPNSEGDLSGYKVHVGTSSRTYSQTIDVGHVTTFTVSNLSDGQSYFAAITAYDIFGNESGFSNEVSAIVNTPNSPPNAVFTFTCSDLTCSFTNTSSDTDGSVVAWRWDLGQGSSSTEQHPTHTYASDGTYNVTLTVTDDDGATDALSQDVAITNSSGGGITLSAVGIKEKRFRRADLHWNGPTSPSIDIYRNGSKITTTANDGAHTDTINQKGKGKKGGQAAYTYQVCEEGTSTCSNEATVTTFN
ncbi:MAG: PKD domain-containing protein [Candidatus Methylomirabilales bacterium]